MTDFGASGIRITPAGQRQRSEEPASVAARSSSNFEPFREDFAFIVKKLKQERAEAMRLNRVTPPMAQIRDPPVAALDTRLDLELPSPSSSEDESNPKVFGDGFSLLELGAVNEMLERKQATQRRRRSCVNDFVEACVLLVPRTKQSGFVVLLLIALAVFFGMVAHTQPIIAEEDSDGIALLKQEFWWGFLARGRQSGLVAVQTDHCRISEVGPRGTVVDSHGMQCTVDDLDPKSSCCFGGTAPAETRTHGAHCKTCRDEDGCCDLLHDCIECCLVPDHWQLIRFQIFALSQNGFNGLKASDFDSFELCQALCRTHGSSLDKHGKFRNLDGKTHCYLVNDLRASPAHG
jgi:hypothetical protein